MALRPRLRPCSIVSRNGSQSLGGTCGGGRRMDAFCEKGRIKSVATLMAGFEVDRRPTLATAIPVAFKYPLAVSRRTPVACSICRNDKPSFPSAMTCCFLSSLKTLLMAARLARRSYVLALLVRFLQD